MTTRPVGAGLALAAAGAVAFSGKAILAKLLYREGLDAVAVLMLRMLFALPFFLLMAWWAGRGKPALTPAQWRRIAVLGFTGYYLASFLDFLGLQYVSASLERLILYLNPTLVLAIGIAFHGLKVTRGQWLAVAISYVGVLLVFGQEVGEQGPHALLGSLLVFASAVSYAVYLAQSGAMVRELGSMRLVGLASTVACVLCIGQYFVLRPAEALFAITPTALGLSLLNSVACTVAPVMMAIERIGPALAAQTGMVGPMSTVVLGVVVLDERFTPAMALGTGLVLVGIGMLARKR
ncbi:MAG TPA: DMT family transporter [Methylibium sp.]|uniref:DMT family transporter n=1 Tax=Methylibium sp. TaxID=2067992 RepID=UPI002DBBDEBD|nr:DMT family transporter [Methylibium sp.]HEU4458780.1 DMT family transporter [Methylibium sp.]